MTKVIIVDDSQAKIDDITCSLGDIDSIDLDIAKNTYEAQILFSENEYDVAIIDLALPTLEGSKASDVAGFELIRSLHAFDWFNKPKTTIVVTEHDALDQRFSEELKNIGVVLYKYSCAADIEDKIKYHVDLSIKLNTQLTNDFDLVFITALEEEAQPIIDDDEFDWGITSLFGLEEINLRTCEVIVDGKKKKLALTILPRMGLVSSSIVTTKLNEILKPKMVIMSGICAGIEDEVKLGDLIIADLSWEWQTGKWKGQDFNIEPYQLSPSPELINFSRRVNENDYLDSLWKETILKRPDQMPKLHIGPIVSGSSVIANAGMMDSLKKQHRKLLGLDMEIFGVYAACHHSKIQPKFLAIKSVCDYGNEVKGDSFHEFCSEISAKFTAKFAKSIL